jgi:hypothetical protein
MQSDYGYIGDAVIFLFGWQRRIFSEYRESPSTPLLPSFGKVPFAPQIRVVRSVAALLH